MLAACINDDDLVRVQSPLSVLNDYPPFNRTGNKWEALGLPAVAGGEGVGVVLATAKNVPYLDRGALEVKDWVIALPEARLAPVGTWRTLCVCDASRLLKVPAQQLPLPHLACSRALCTAYRLLEDYGGLKPGDTIIQNAADLPTGQAVIQLCKLLKIRTINLVQDDDAFERTQELLKQLGATIVLRDNAKLNDFLSALGSEMPRLGLDALGGENGKRMAIALRPEATLVIHSLQHGRLPSLSPSLLMYQQISLHGFNLSQWVSEEGQEVRAAPRAPRAPRPAPRASRLRGVLWPHCAPRHHSRAAQHAPAHLRPRTAPARASAAGVPRHAHGDRRAGGCRQAQAPDAQRARGGARARDAPRRARLSPRAGERAGLPRALGARLRRRGAGQPPVL